jgi:dTDP-4-amino-4,6-dideoxygalactose transaminase
MIPPCRSFIPPEATCTLQACVESGWVGYGPACRALESRFTSGRGGFALATSSCTSALHLAGLLCRQDETDEVVVPAVTFISTAMAFRAAGVRVRIADVDPETLLLTEQSAAACISPATRAVVAVHLYGQRLVLDGLRELCDQRGCYLIEDCAHRLDLLDEESPQGDFACYSFNALKEAPCGEGGLLWGRNAGHEQAAREISNLGLAEDTMRRADRLDHRAYAFGQRVGLKLRLSDANAALVQPSLDMLAESRSRRGGIAAAYDKALAGLAPYLRPLTRRDDDSFLMYVVRASGLDVDRLRSDIASAGVATSVHYPSLSQHPLFSGDECPVAEAASSSLFTLPSFLQLSSSDQTIVIEAVRDAVRRQAGPVGLSA